MKKIFKSRLFFFILGALIFGSISVVLAYSYFAQDVGFTPTDSEWNVEDSKEALDDLYRIANENVEIKTVGGCFYGASQNNPSCSASYTATTKGTIIISYGVRAAGSAMASSSWTIKVDGVNHTNKSANTWGFIENTIINLEKGQQVSISIKATGNNTGVWSHLNFVKNNFN